MAVSDQGHRYFFYLLGQGFHSNMLPPTPPTDDEKESRSLSGEPLDEEDVVASTEYDDEEFELLFKRGLDEEDSVAVADTEEEDCDSLFGEPLGGDNVGATEEPLEATFDNEQNDHEYSTAELFGEEPQKKSTAPEEAITTTKPATPPPTNPSSPHYIPFALPGPGKKPLTLPDHAADVPDTHIALDDPVAVSDKEQGAIESAPSQETLPALILPGAPDPSLVLPAVAAPPDAPVVVRQRRVEARKKNGGWRFKCRFCPDREFDRAELLRNHMCSIHNLIHPRTEAGKYAFCQRCGQYWLHKSDIPNAHKDKNCGDKTNPQWQKPQSHWTPQQLADTFVVAKDGEPADSVKRWYDANGNPAQPPADVREKRENKRAVFRRQEARDRESKSVVDLTEEEAPSTDNEQPAEPEKISFAWEPADAEQWTFASDDEVNRQIREFRNNDWSFLNNPEPSKRKRDEDEQAGGRNVRQRIS